MKLSPVVARYFEAWICRDSWDSQHPLDRQRFYRFVKAVARYGRRRPPLAGHIKELVEQRWRSHRGVSRLKHAVTDFTDLYETLLEYERTRGFPDPLIERTDIVRYYLRLTLGKGPDDAHVDRTMTETWGGEWRALLKRDIVSP